MVLRSPNWGTCFPTDLLNTHDLQRAHEHASGTGTAATAARNAVTLRGMGCRVPSPSPTSDRDTTQPDAEEWQDPLSADRYRELGPSRP